MALNWNTHIKLAKVLYEAFPSFICQPKLFILVLFVDVAFHVQIGIDVGGDANALLLQVLNHRVQIGIP